MGDANDLTRINKSDVSLDLFSSQWQILFWEHTSLHCTGLWKTDRHQRETPRQAVGSMHTGLYSTKGGQHVPATCLPFPCRRYLFIFCLCSSAGGSVGFIAGSGFGSSLLSPTDHLLFYIIQIFVLSLLLSTDSLVQRFVPVIVLSAFFWLLFVFWMDWGDLSSCLYP